MSNETKRARGRPRVDATPLNVRIPPSQLAALDEWIQRQPDAPSRPEGLRRLAERALTREPKRTAHRWAANPELWVFGIRTISDLWSKLVWDIEQFENLLIVRPVDIVAIPYAYPNVCVSALALRDWFHEECIARARAAKKRWSRSDSFEIIRSKIRWSQLADDVANTFKHRGYRSDAFKDGIIDVRVSYPPALQGEFEQLSGLDSALFTLRHNDVARWEVIFRDNGTGHEMNALAVFSAWEKDWHALLGEMGMLDEE